MIGKLKLCGCIAGMLLLANVALSTRAQVVDEDRSPGVVSAYQSIGNHVVEVGLYKKDGNQYRLVAKVEVKGRITFTSKAIKSGVENLVRLQVQEASGKWLPITKRELVDGRAIVTTDAGKTYAIFDLGIGPFAGEIAPIEPATNPPSTAPSTRPAQTNPASASARQGIVAVMARSAPASTEAQRKYTKELTDQLRAQLAADATITTLPAAVTTGAIGGLQVPGFVNSNNELRKAVAKLPADCNIVVVVGPHPGDSGFFPIAIARRSDLAAAVYRFGPPKGDTPLPAVVANACAMVRQDIEAVLQQSR